MYLTGKKYIGMRDKETLKITGVDGIDTDKVSGIEMELAYWRKANAIHKWFVDNVQENNDDCREYYVSYDTLTSLYNTVVAVINEPSLAHKILPVQSGFFFGSTEYDEYYFSDLEYTRKTLGDVLLNWNDDISVYYQSSW